MSEKHCWVAYSLAVLLPVFLFISNSAMMLDLWKYSFDDGTYSHAFLMPPVFLYLIYEAHARGRLRFNDGLPLAVLAAFILVTLLYLAAYSAQIAILYRVLFPLSVLLAMFLLFRPSIAVAMPVVVIWFVFPIWGVLTAPLQGMSVSAVNFLMSFSSIPTYVEGNFVQIPSGLFEIAGGCSGLRYFIVSLLLCMLFVYLNISNWRKALIFIAVALLGALVINWIRIVILIYVGHFTEMQSSLMEDHNQLGWYLYVPYLIALMAFGGRLRDELPKEEAEQHEKSEQETGRVTRDNPAISGSKVPVLNLSVLIFFGVVLSSTTVATVASWKGSSTALQSPLKESASLIGWEPGDAEDLVPAVQDFSSVAGFSRLVSDNRLLYRKYLFSGEDEALKATYYLHQAMPEEGWRQVSRDSDELANYLVARDGFRQNAVAAYWYQYGELTTPSRQHLRLERLKSFYTLNRSTALHWLWLPCEQECEAELETIKQQVKALQ
ncbi:exosortase [Motiliproteus sp. MSK22-1]|uniref:exosortase n=1 Tax=Motiliproteus sp. MSK22-1 TaxID=1897630 RepID=UPI0009776442|nr:exosortase [Motiliproteus sp. MSK22-1]OMH25663.1 hypothetical protein BGP75_24275 [Motiliproteus sp. MSK22-1]